ncbi:MAG TPA: A/G-specific adenine glycosylase, partial [Bacteroidetes bacterium]|nr:A/G-specific adenine glycosylase [Bacteroidota bacterium]
MKNAFGKKLLDWYEQNKRNLPWRNVDDPYKIWISEIILQQTRVGQGMAYYQKFIASFPDVYSLAKASSQEVYKLWQGLGYYNRAENLMKTARHIAEDFG